MVCFVVFTGHQKLEERLSERTVRPFISTSISTLKEEGMKSDGDAMEPTEPTEAVPAPSSTQEAPSQPEPADDAAPGTNLKTNGKPLAVDPKVKPKVDLKKPVAKSTGASANHSRPGAASQRSVNDVKSLNNVSAKKPATAAKSSSAAGAVPKRPMGVATVSTAVKSQTKVPEKKPVGQSRTASLPAAPLTNGTKLAVVNGSAKTRPGSETVRAKTPGKEDGTEQRRVGVTLLASKVNESQAVFSSAAPSRPAASSGPKPSSSTAAKAGVPASAKPNKYVCQTPLSVVVRCCEAIKSVSCALGNPCYQAACNASL